MAVATAPGPRRSLLGMVASAFAGRSKAKGQTSSVAAAIQDHLLTVCAFAAVTADGFVHSAGWGLGALAVSLLVLDFKLRG